MGKGPGKSSSTCNKIFNQDEQKVAPSEENIRATSSKDNLEFKFFSSPEVDKQDYISPRVYGTVYFDKLLKLARFEPVQVAPSPVNPCLQVQL